MVKHLGPDRFVAVSKGSGNICIRHSAKTITDEFGVVEIAVPRDSDARFASINGVNCSVEKKDIDCVDLAFTPPAPAESESQPPQTARTPCHLLHAQ